MSIATSILDLIEDAAHKQNFSRVTEIRLEIGKFSGVESTALLFCLDVVLRNTCATGANLQVEIIFGQGYCPQCKDTSIIEAIYDACPKCGYYPLYITGGTELRVKDLLVE